MKNIYKLAALAAFAVGSNANAELIATDWKVEGDSAAVYDTESNTTWLQINYSTKSIQTMLDQMVLGGDLEGWSFATRSQIDSLWANGRYVVNAHFNRVNGAYVAGRAYNPETDTTYFVGTSNNGSGWYDRAGYLNANMYGWWIVKGAGVELNPESSLYSLPSNYVNASAVPLAGSALLMVAGLAGLRRRKK